VLSGRDLRIVTPRLWGGSISPRGSHVVGQCGAGHRENAPQRPKSVPMAGGGATRPFPVVCRAAPALLTTTLIDDGENKCHPSDACLR
jgi:hypothetical protein